MKISFSKIFLSLAFLAICGEGFAQDFSNRGKEFWVAYGHHQFMEPGESPSNGQNMVIYLSAEQAATVTVTVDSSANMFGGNWTRTYVVPANTVISTGTATPISGFPTPLTPAPIPKAGTYDFRLYSTPCSFSPPGAPCGSEQIFRGKGIHITSDVPIVAYAHIYGQTASGATMLMPVESWGYTYTSINSNQTNASSSFSWMYVIAKHDSTVITITPSVTTRLLKPAGVPFNIMLNKGQIYQLVGQTTGNNGLELTGTTVKSIANSVGNCYPIAVFAGSSRTGGFCNNASGSRDNDMQQAFPQQAWGKRYLTAPLSQSGGISTYSTSPYKIAVKDPATVVKRNGVTLTGLVNNYYRFESNQPELIEADKPVMVGQFMAASGSCLSGSGDPEMMYISPIEQAIKRVGFYRTTLENISVNYVTLIIPSNGMSSLTIEGIPWAGITPSLKHSYPHPRLAGYTIAIRRWTAAQSQVIMQSDSAFNGITYGLGGAESYGYNAGTFLKNLNAAGSILNANDTTGATSSAFTCTNTPVKLSVLLAYETPPTRLLWRLSEVGGGLTPNTDVVDNSPTPVGMQTVNGISYTKYNLPGTYQFSTIGTFRIPITATHPSVENCTNTEDLYYEVEVRGKPVANFAINATGCYLDTAQFIGETVSANGFNLNQWLYTFHDATISNAKDTAKRYAAPGTYNVNLRVISQEGCVSDTTKQISLSAAPVTNFTTTPAAVCQGASITFNDASSYVGAGNINNSWWDFGDGNTQTYTNANPITHTYATFGTFTVRHTAGVGASCVGDTVTRVVTVNAQPNARFTYPAGCLAASGTVQFNSTATAPDGQAITGHLWNFGDPASGAANTSTLASPTHTYPGYGTYTITYRSTTANGCFKDTSVTATFNLAPTFSYPALGAVCQANPPLSVANATVTNAVPGAGVYSGPGTTASGMFNPAVAGPGTHTIKYYYTTTGNCLDSTSQTILVNPTPNAGFSNSASGCLDPTGVVNFTYTGTPIPGQTYSWNFGDPGSGANNTSTLQNPTHNYTTGPYTITLTVTTPAGCTKDSVLNTTFNTKPALTWPALAAVCESVTGTVSVATATVTNGVTGAGVYSGTATDAAGNFNPSVAGPGTFTIKYVYTATGNCKDSISRTIQVFAQPAAEFTYPTAACLPATGVANFTYTGSAGAGQTYLWNFGDPASGANNSSTAANPSHTYTNTGTYSVSVSVTNANGCVDTETKSLTFSVTPALAYPALVAVCQETPAFSIATATVTNAVAGTGVYSGPGTNAAGMFDPALAGPGTHTITYTFTSTGNCTATITRPITVNPTPNAGFSNSASGCLDPTGVVNFTYTGTPITGQTYAWNFGDPGSGANNTSTLQNPTHNYTTGPYTITLRVTTPAGCIKDSVLNTTFNTKPALTWPALAAVCESVTGTVSVATATVTNGVTGTGVYSGTATDAAGNFNPSVAGPGTFTIKYIFTATGNCVDSISRTIQVYAQPAAEFTYPTAACLPATGVANFTYTGSAGAGQTYLWNFGDPASGANNSSTAANPSHTYTNTGTYSVSVTVTNANGCVDTETKSLTFSVTPSLAYPALAAVCESTASPVNIATATVTNGVSGTGVYSGPGTNAAGNFDPAVAGPGTHTVTYTFTSTGNCTATITSTIMVNPQPAAEFTYPTATCLPATGVANFNYTGSASAGQTYLWNFGDPASGANNSSTAANPSHTYTNTGTYSVSVTVTNANGCVDTETKSLTFSVTQALAYPALAAVCENATGVISVATATVTNNVAGTGIYSGPGTNAAGSFNPATAGAGTHTITYTFTSTGNCTATTTSTITVNPKPLAAFTMPATACLGTATNITGISNNANITTWRWFFGDGTNATYSNANAFTKTYTTAGTYTVKLVTESTNGCISDTATQTITINAVPFASFSVPASVCMPNGTATFTNQSTVSDGASLTYLWNFGDGSATSTATNAAHMYAASGTYPVTLTVTGGGGCSKDTTISFSNFFDKPLADFTVTPDVSCQGTPNVFTDNSSAPGSTIQSRFWMFGDGTTSTQTNPSKTYNNPGTYDVKLVVTSTQGCVSDTISSRITVFVQPVVDAGPSFVVPQGTVIKFNPTVNDSTSTTLLWTPALGLSSATALRPTLTANFDQDYTLTALSGNKCTASDMLSVKILKPLNIPNAFSPNGDGTNDTWIIENLADYPGATVEVYNRYGQMLWRTVGYNSPWDGKIKGNPLPLATYYYIIQLNNGFKPLSGSITIIK